MKLIKLKYWKLVIVVFAFCSCSKMDDNYKEFIKEGEITYAKAADSAAVRAGRNRVEIALTGLDPRVSKIKVYWNNKTKSQEASVTTSSGKLNVIIPALEEGAYSFDIYTFDKAGNSSIPKTVIGNVYGDNYSNTLRERGIQYTNVIRGVGTIQWLASSAGVISTEVAYVDSNGVSKLIYTPANVNVTTLAAFKEGRNVTYRTLFLPEPGAIDTFFTPAIIRTVVQIPVLLDRTLFANVKVLNDKWQPNGGNANWVIEKAWDGITNDDNILFHAARTGFPATVTIDLAKVNKLTSMKVWGRTAADALFNKGNLKDFEVYGRETAPNLNDSTMTGWVKILTGSSRKPSGKPLGTNTTEDLEYAKAGEEYSFDPNAPPVRYIRLRVLDSWGPPADNYWYFTELSFWGLEK